MRTWPALRLTGLSAPPVDDRLPVSELVLAALTDFDLAAIEEHSADEWTVFFTAAAVRAEAGRAVARLCPAVSLTEVEVADEDWAARSQASLGAIRAGHIVVTPPWDVARSAQLLTIVIQPSMGFGTGHHASTRLCLQALQQVALDGRSVLDVGTGSGVLAIAASLLGASSVTAIDNDPDAIEAAGRNLALNPDARVRLAVADLRSLPMAGAGGMDRAGADGFDVVVANITGAHLIAAREPLAGAAGAAGRIILGGIMASEASDVLRHYQPRTLLRRLDEDGWVCLTLEPPPVP